MKRITLTVLFALLWCASMVAQSYNFKTVVYRDPNVSFTQLLGINNNNVIAGYHNFQQNQGFTLVLPNAFTTENFPNSTMTQVVGINNTGTTDGFYVDNSGITHGFFRNSSGQFTTVDYPRPEIATSFNQLLSQNDYYEAAGYYSNSINNTTPDIPYVYDEIGGVFHVLTIPGAVGGAQATGINNSGVVCGFWIDVNGVNHGYLLNRGIFMTLDVPSSTFTQALGLNNNGQVVGSFIDAGGQTHGFVYYIGTARFVTIDEPNGVGTTLVNGINDAGTLVGFFGNAPINTGFVATPISSTLLRESVRPESVSPVAVRAVDPQTDSVNVPPSDSPVAVRDIEQLDNGSSLPTAHSPVSVSRSVRPVAVGGTVPPIDSPVAVTRSVKPVAVGGTVPPIDSPVAVRDVQLRAGETSLPSAISPVAVSAR